MAELNSLYEIEKDEKINLLQNLTDITTANNNDNSNGKNYSKSNDNINDNKNATNLKEINELKESLAIRIKQCEGLEVKMILLQSDSEVFEEKNNSEKEVGEYRAVE